MGKKIVRVVPTNMGNMHLDFEDGTSQVLPRGSHERFRLKAGDQWPAQPAANLVPTKVAKVSPRSDGHHDVTLEDGTTVFIERGKKVPRVGEHHLLEMNDAMDTQGSEAAPILSESADSGSAGQDETGTSPESSDGPRKKRKQSAQAEEA